MPRMVEEQKGPDEVLRDAQDRIHTLVHKLDALERAVLYKYLYALGYRMHTIEAEIQRLARP